MRWDTMHMSKMGLDRKKMRWDTVYMSKMGPGNKISCQDTGDGIITGLYRKIWHLDTICEEKSI